MNKNTQKQRGEKIKTNINRPRINYFLILIVMLTSILCINSVSAVVSYGDNVDKVFYFKLNENTGTSVASELGGYTGTLSSIDWINSITGFNYAVRTDSTSDYISSTFTPSESQFDEHSLEFRINTTDTTANGYIMGSATGADATKRGYSPQLINGKATILASQGSSFGLDNYDFGCGTINNGQWHHLVYVKNSTHQWTLYQDGVACPNVTTFDLAGASTDSWMLASRQAHSNTPLMDLDQIVWWDKELTATEVLSLNNSILDGGISISIILDSPTDGSTTSSTTISLNATFNITGTNFNYTWRNATFYNWNDTAVYNQSLVYLSGNNTQNTTTISGLVIGDYNWNVYGCYANNTYSNCTWANNNFSLSFRPFEIDSQQYVNNVYETDYQRFNLTITTIPEILSVNSKLNYNGTLYSGNTSCSLGTCNIFSEIDIPLISSTNMNKSFFWEITVYDGTTSYIFNTSNEYQEQNISRIYLEECNTTYTTKAINFTSYIESNLSQINPFKVSGTFNFWLGQGSIYRNISFDKSSTQNLSICISPIDKTFYSNAQLDYSFTNENITYVPRNYYFDNATLNNVTQEIPLYLLNAEDSTTFIIKVQDQKLSAVDDALVYIQRYYPSDGTFKTVQIAKTDSNGETIGFYETETVDYRHIIIKNGEILLQTTQQKVVGKEVPYTLTFTTGEALGYPWNSFEKNGNVYSSLTFNETNKVVTFTYIDTSGLTSLARLVVFKESMTNSTNLTICDSTSTQSSATITCNLSTYSGNFIAYGYIESDITDLINIIITGAKEIFDREGLLLGVFIIMVSGFAFMWNPSAGIVAINAALIFTNIIGFISVSPIFIFGSIAISFIAIILLKT